MYPDVDVVSPAAHWSSRALGIAEGPKGGIAVYKDHLVVSYTIENKLRVYQLPVPVDSTDTSSAAVARPLLPATAAAVSKLPARSNCVELKLLFEYGSHGDAPAQFNGVGRLCTGSVSGLDVVLACDIGNKRVQVVPVFDLFRSGADGAPPALPPYVVDGTPTCVSHTGDVVAIGVSAPTSSSIVLFGTSSQCSVLKVLCEPLSGLAVTRMASAPALSFRLARSSQLPQSAELDFDMVCFHSLWNNCPIYFFS